MSAALSLAPEPLARERLVATAAYALALHAVVLLGVHLHRPAAVPAEPPPLEIVLLRNPQPRAADPPPRPDYLAPESHRGSGQQVRAALPETRPAGARTAPRPAAPAAPRPPAPPPAPVRAQRTEIAAPDAPAPPAPVRPPAPAAPASLPSAAQLLAGVRDYAELAARAGTRDVTSTRRPRERYVDASTREHAYAAYLEAWRRKVEAIGNLNYPADARAQGLSGTLLLRVEVAADGSVLGVELRRSSGHAVLDQAAQDIVRLAAPFSPFPDEIRAQTDVLVITRTWQFLNDRLAGQ